MQSKADMTVCCIPPAMLGKLWGELGPMLVRGQLEITPNMRDALVALDGLLRKVHASGGSTQIWAVFDDKQRKPVAALITELLLDGGEKYVWASRMSGENIGKWGAPISDALHEYAKDENAKAVRCVGRYGLRRVYTGATCVGEHDVKGNYIYERLAA